MSDNRTELERRDAPSSRDRLKRRLFRIVWLVFCRASPVACHSWRRSLLRFFGAKMDDGTLVYPSVSIWAPWNLQMGNGAVLGPEVVCYNVDVINLAENALVSQGAYLCSASHDFNDPRFPVLSAPIMLARKSWVCSQAFVGPGVTVNEGSVVGARAVVTRDVPRLEVVVGNPARRIAARNDSVLF